MDDANVFVGVPWDIWLIVTGAIIGFLITWFSNKFFNKRGTFEYFVQHGKLGSSSIHPVFGKVDVSWNSLPVEHLFVSTITLKNASLNDYSNIKIQTFTNSTRLLTESSQLASTPKNLNWTEEYAKLVFVPEGEQPSDNQQLIFHGQREHLVPVFNRGQTIKLTYLNAANSDQIPTIWLSATVKGVRVKFKVPTETILGVTRSQAVITGALFGFAVVVIGSLALEASALVALVCLTVGMLVVFPGAALVRLYRAARDAVGN